MGNHVHIVAVPERDYSLAQSIVRTNPIYTQVTGPGLKRSIETLTENI
jgi:hypothetical protein